MQTPLIGSDTGSGVGEEEEEQEEVEEEQGEAPTQVLLHAQMTMMTPWTRRVNTLLIVFCMQHSRQWPRYAVVARVVHLVLILRVLRILLALVLSPLGHGISTYMATMTIWLSSTCVAVLMCWHLLPSDWFPSLVDTLVADNASRRKHVEDMMRIMYPILLVCIVANSIIATVWAALGVQEQAYWPFDQLPEHKTLAHTIINIVIPFNRAAWVLLTVPLLPPVLVWTRQLDELLQQLKHVDTLDAPTFSTYSRVHRTLSCALMRFNDMFGPLVGVWSGASALMLVLLLVRRTMHSADDTVRVLPDDFWLLYITAVCSVFLISSARLHGAFRRCHEQFAALLQVDDDDPRVPDNNGAKPHNALGLPTTHSLSLMLQAHEARVTAVRLFNAVPVTTALLSSILSLLVSGFVVTQRYAQTGSG